MSVNNKRSLSLLFGAVTLLFTNGCWYNIREVTVETRFLETKEPAPGSLTSIYPLISWPPPPRFEPVVSDDGLFEIKVVNNVLSGRFRLSGHEELDELYSFLVDLDKNNTFTKWNEPTKTEWKGMFYHSSNTSEHVEIEYRVILPSNKGH